MINLYFNEELIQPKQAIKFPKIKVDRSKDTSEKKPIPTIFSMKIENDTNHDLKNLIFLTNIPNDTYDIANFPKEIPEGKTAIFNFYFYARRALDNRQFPKSIFFNVKGDESFLSVVNE